MVRKNKILFLDEDIYKEFKIKCIKEGIFLRDKLEELMKKWIKNG